MFIVTCSDSRDARTDRGGQVLEQGLEQAGHTVAGRRWVKDDVVAIRQALEEAERTGARAVIFTGGTGIGRRDSTLEALAPLFDKTLPGFGELFRWLSFQEIGAAAMLSPGRCGNRSQLARLRGPGARLTQSDWRWIDSSFRSSDTRSGSSVGDQAHVFFMRHLAIGAWP